LAWSAVLNELLRLQPPLAPDSRLIYSQVDKAFELFFEFSPVNLAVAKNQAFILRNTAIAVFGTIADRTGIGRARRTG
jgi:hypothetical protein